MIELAELAKKYQTEGERTAYMETVTSPCTFAPERVATAANLLTIASHLREAAEREDAEKARETYVRNHFGESMVETMRKLTERADREWDKMVQDQQDQLAASKRTYSEAFGCVGSVCRIGEMGWTGCEDRCGLVELEHKGIIAPPSQEGPEPNGYKQGDDLITEKDGPDEPPLSPPKGSRAPAPARLRDELTDIIDRYPGIEQGATIVDRILDALAGPTEIQREARYCAGEWSRRNIEAFIADVKEGRL